MAKIADKWLESGGGLGLGSEGKNETSITMTTDSTETFETFSDVVTSSFKMSCTVIVDATTDSIEVFDVEGISTGSDWILILSKSGNNESGIEFTIDTSGNLKYNITSPAGFVSGKLIYSVITTSV